ncbi:MAG TPA: M15 family metallopeptidase [Nocardioidaceae bacterium]|nr:M15 family metallopeptidase [Nocardioidaceae bacterium]
MQAATGAVAAFVALTLVGCSSPREPVDRTAPPSSAASPGASATTSGPSVGSPGPSSGPGADATPSGGSFAVADPGPLKPPLLTADLLVTSSTRIPDTLRRRVSAVPGVRAAMSLSVASLSANGRTLTVAAADPGRFRRFTSFGSARSDEVWQRVAGGEVAVDPSLPEKLEKPRGFLRLGTSQQAPAVHIGAYAPLVNEISAVVNDKRGRQLALPQGNALLLSTGTRSPAQVTDRLKQVLGPGITLRTLALEFDVDEPQTAVLSGASVSDAVGTFTYTAQADGSVIPDPRWVEEYIRTETVPILGSVTGNKGMLPQLRAALEEVVRAGLSGAINPGEFGGCYVPRFIARNPANGLSLHSWGMAVDLNVPGNLRGTVGEMDRRVVAIFKKWGFAWGGDWSYTDPMHFEMNRVVRAG